MFRTCCAKEVAKDSSSQIQHGKAPVAALDWDVMHVVCLLYLLSSFNRPPRSKQASANRHGRDRSVSFDTHEFEFVLLSHRGSRWRSSSLLKVSAKSFNSVV